MIALYALVLQFVIAGLMPVAVSGPDRILCLHTSDIGAGKGEPAPVHRHADCCTAAQILGTAALSRASATRADWPRRPVIRIAWIQATDALPRAPPGRIAHPRGPPAA
ncbi:hypothetical protein U8607_09975 [Methylobacterium durans]|uniref:hypothetical protein n=1 Tax=Methylobacterium durans TaxID=2202825 RepID=UPI002AFF6B81|nr:hypothetical protein [Methylobacterium durans]MEA1832413.1 hypothetical protein [Methylobacterium durans]